ncbi:hypothetical protein [Cohnella laeviribosi]|uniref:hypothetical protein n=1 Tax=Cohnella laeviribosi TaxID=380174 RepID=UPI003D1A04E2
MSAEQNVSLPGGAPSFRHLRRMTDDTGLLEHALGRIPRRKEGYTTDDNARALWVVTEWLSPERAKLLTPDDRQRLASLADIYLAFMLWCQRDDGWFHNNIAYDRTPEPEFVSYDCQGRSVWSCADAWIRLPGQQRETAFALLRNAFDTIGRIDSLRGQAFALAACAHLLEAEDQERIRLPQGWRDQLREHVDRLEEAIVAAFLKTSDNAWRWFEPAMTYSNGVLPWSLLRAYRITGRTKTLEIGLDSLFSLRKAMTADGGWFRPIGNEKWHSREATSQWDQQPLEMFKLALALDEGASALELAAKRGVSPDLSGLYRTDAAAMQTAAAKEDVRTQPEAAASVEELRQARDRCLAWFHGDNDLRVPMADPSDGSCFDGLRKSGPNINCGAEAVISYLMTEALCSDRLSENRQQAS